MGVDYHFRFSLFARLGKIEIQHPPHPTMPSKKITFDDKDLEIQDTPLDLTEGPIEVSDEDASEASEEEDEGESDDSDDAPEEESLTSGKKAALEQTRAEEDIKAQFVLSFSLSPLTFVERDLNLLEFLIGVCTKE